MFADVCTMLPDSSNENPLLSVSVRGRPSLALRGLCSERHFATDTRRAEQGGDGGRDDACHSGVDGVYRLRLGVTFLLDVAIICM